MVYDPPKDGFKKTKHTAEDAFLRAAYGRDSEVYRYSVAGCMETLFKMGYKLVPVEKDDSPDSGYYPVTIVRARYGGVYEGGVWLAWPLYEGDLPQDAFSDDVTCSNWWRTHKEDPIGRGRTPNAAFADMQARIERNINDVPHT